MVVASYYGGDPLTSDLRWALLTMAAVAVVIIAVRSVRWCRRRRRPWWRG